MIPDTVPRVDLDRRRALWILGGIVVVGAALRFYGLNWATPYKHFQIDEYSVIGPADDMRTSMAKAVDFPKFFIYPPLLMFLVNVVRTVYEWFTHPLDMLVRGDVVTYMVLSRAISATFGTLTIPLVYAIAARVSGRRAGLFAAALLAVSVLHLRDSHFATTDITMTFFCALTLWFSLRLAERGGWVPLIACGAVFALAINAKYTGLFVLGVVGLAYLLAPGRPTALKPASKWGLWVLRGLVPIVVGAVVAVVVNPLPVLYPEKFYSDVKDWVFDPLSGRTTYAWLAHFADVTSPRLFWFTNLLWWGFGPALEIAGLVGVVWMFAKRNKAAALVGAYAVLYFAIAGNTIAPFIRYMMPLAPVLAIAAGALLADGLARPRLRWAAIALAVITIGSTGVYAAAYMNVFRQPDSRIEAARWIDARIPAGARVLVEPAQNMPPMGSYYRKPVFDHDYLIRCKQTRTDRYQIFTMDVYQRLFSQRLCGDERGDDTDPQGYINRQLAEVDWIIIDDTNVQNYQHLPEPKYRVVKQYYRDLLGERLGFKMVRTFKTYPRLFGRDINDDGAELTFRLFDHPRVYIFQRVTPVVR